MKKERRHILIVKMSSLGDVILSSPTAQMVKELEPQSFVGWLVEERNWSVLKGNPFVDALFIWDRSFQGFLKVMREIRRYEWDVALDQQGLFKSAIFCFLSGAKTRIGHEEVEHGSRIFYTHLVPNISSLHAVESYLFTACSLISYFSKEDFRRALKEGMEKVIGREKRLKPVIYLSKRERARAGELLGDASPFLALCPGTTWQSKHWPAQRWARVGDSLVKEGHRVVFLGADRDIPAVREIKRFMREPHLDLTGKTDVRELAGILERAELVISVDSGAMHLATAVDTPVLALFGPTNPQTLGPYGDGHRVIYKKASCSPCRDKSCSRGSCMELIEEEEVLEAAKEMLEERRWVAK